MSPNYKKKMSKRSGYSGTSNNLNSNEAKKPRVETNNVDDLWGDDLDFDDVEKCVMMATQMCEQREICTQKSDVSILPSYGCFRQQSNEMCTSTPLVPPTNFTAKAPIQSLDHSKSDDNLKLKLAQLEKQYQEKDGEVRILRSQLSELKRLHEIQQDKSNQEWSAKFLLQKKQMQQIEKELELKVTNAEFTLLSLNSKIASKNLKNLDLTQKLKDLTNPNSTCSQFFKNFNENGRSTVVTKGQINERKMTDFKLRVVTRKGRPLKDALFYIFSLPLTEMCKIDVSDKLTCKNVKHPLWYFIRDGALDEGVKKLMGCNSDEFNSLENQQHIYKLLLLSEQLLKNLITFLEELKSDNNRENNYVIYLENLSIDASKDGKDKIGLITKHILICLADILPHSTVLKDHLLSNESSFVTLLIMLLKLIPKLNCIANFDGFIIGTTYLLLRMFQNLNHNNCNDSNMILNVTKEIILCPWSHSAFTHFLKFLHFATLQRNFLSKLCTKQSNELKVHQENILQCNKDVCWLQILFELLREFLKSKFSCVENKANVLKCILNSVATNQSWLFYQDDKCPCISKMVKLYLDTMYTFIHLDNCDEMMLLKSTGLYTEVLTSGIDTLHILTINLYDSVAKYVDTYSQYKSILEFLLKMQDILQLQESKVEILKSLCKNEEIPHAPKIKFVETALWKLI